MATARPRSLIRPLLGVLALASTALALSIAGNPEPVRRAAVVAMSDDYAEVPTTPVTPLAGFAQDIPIRLERVAKGIPQPTDLQFPPGVTELAVVLQKTGTARWLDVTNGTHGTLFSIEVKTDSEEGLLGLAFHPRFAENGRFFLNYVIARGREDVSRVAEWRFPDPSELRAKSATETRVLMEVVQPYANHDAGQLAFGPDGYLYVGWGDGGYRDDPHGHGQDAATMLGSMLRIDVDRSEGGRPYAVPADNPFVGKTGFLPETWAYGLRNPWRYSFDPKGRLVVADVGQDQWEEVDIVEAGDNLGWNVREGFACFRKNEAECARDDLVDPVLVYGHDVGASITGGYVYRGKRVPALAGLYVYGDFVSGRLFATALPDDRHVKAVPRSLGKWPILPVTFGRDADGEIYVAAFERGEIYRFTAP